MQRGAEETRRAEVWARDGINMIRHLRSRSLNPSSALSLSSSSSYRAPRSSLSSRCHHCPTPLITVSSALHYSYPLPCTLALRPHFHHPPSLSFGMFAIQTFAHSPTRRYNRTPFYYSLCTLISQWGYVASDGWVWECGWYGCARWQGKGDRKRQGKEINK